MSQAADPADEALTVAVAAILTAHPGADTYTARLARLCLDLHHRAAAADQRLAVLERGGLPVPPKPAQGTPGQPAPTHGPARAAAHALLQTMWLHANYRLDYRANWDAVLGALAALAPDLAARVVANEGLVALLTSEGVIADAVPAGV